MLCLPTIHASSDEPGTSVYVSSGPLDNVRIHCVMLEDGIASPGLFVGATYYTLNNPA